MCCKKCSKIIGSLLIVAAILLLLQDLSVWNVWGIQWYTMAFVIGGLSFCGMSKCDACQVGMGGAPAKGKK